MQGVSIIVCCYNSAQRLPKTIEHLAKQIVPNNIVWEVIVINNNCTDNTTEVAQNEWNKYNVAVPFQIVDQPIPGLSAAREKGFDTAKYEYIIMCDDDNWLNEDYVKIAFDIMISKNNVGMLGGFGIPILEIDKPVWFDMFAGDYATGMQHSEEGYVTKCKGYVYGSGAILRKSILAKIKEKNIPFYTTDRMGSNLTSGGDNELAINIRLVGDEIYYSPALKYKHFIPKSRLTWFYLKKLHFSFGYSSSLLIIKSLLLIDFNRPKYKLQWQWLFTTSIYHLLRFVFTHYYQILKGNPYYQIALIRNFGYAMGIFKQRKELVKIHNDMIKNQYLSNKR